MKTSHFKVELVDERETNYQKLFGEKRTGPKQLQQNWRVSKGQYISEGIYEVIISPKIRTKNCKDFCPVLKHSTGQKFLQYLVQTMTS